MTIFTAVAFTAVTSALMNDASEASEASNASNARQAVPRKGVVLSLPLVCETSYRFLPVFLMLVIALVSPSARAVSDPLEPINRPMYYLNEAFDRVALKPAARGYDYVTPQPVKRGVGNFFANLYDMTSAVNAVLQWRWENAMQSGGRVLVNTTVGVLGFVDVASRMGVSPARTDFGQTLAIWGFPEGPYVMLPLLGPRTFRSGAGSVVDTLALSLPPWLDDKTRFTIWGVELIHLRSTFLEADELLSGDRYIFVRDAYLQQRATLINDGQIVDDFSSFEDDWDSELEEL